MNFWKRYPADYRKKTARLTLAMHGAYTLLLDEIYITEAPLPPEIDELYQICHARTKLERDAVDTVAARYFPVGGDAQRYNARASEELEEAAPAVAAARENGKKGGRPKKPSGNPAGSGSGNPAGSQTETHKEPSSKPPQSSDTSPSLRSGEGARKRTPRFDPSKIELPPWLSSEVWQRWCRDRKARNKPITEDGATGQLKRLEAYREEGVHTPEAVLEHAIESGNQGLFPPPLPRGARGAPAKSFRSQDVETKQSRTAELTGGIFPGPSEPAAAGDVIEMEGGHARITGR